ncbi:hypothetical protein CFD26_103065 [Aspergillus turcosus]|uniref:Protein kinase domain-containing protein n=1 Tax=Aspergillus turcosus TaxID=1245748 RepID=A0A421D1D3_9EURO|nr:hypothetical protein CFD26_103065 [Aspergillus turcosus]
MSSPFLDIQGNPIPQEQVLGSGGSAVVLLQNDVAVKTPLRYLWSSDSDVQVNIESLRREQAVYRRLQNPGDERSEGIVRCIGFSNEATQLAYMVNGDLRTYLAKCRPSHQLQLTWFNEMARTLSYIHDRRVLVADIASRNFLLDSDLSLKICDFSEASLLPLDSDMEAVDDNGYTTQIDIGLLGAVMYEVSLKLKPVSRPSQNIRIISWDDGLMFVQVDNHLRHLSHHPLDNDELALVTDAILPSWIQQAIVLSGSHKAAFLCDKGQLFILLKQDRNDKHSTRLRSIPGRQISHIAARSVRMHNPALISGAVALVLASDARTVVSFDSRQPMIAWLTDKETKQDPTHSVKFADPIVKLTSKFAALDEAGTVHVWGEKSPVQPPDPPDEDEVFQEAWNRYVLFGDPIQRWPSRLPEALDYTPRSLPLLPIKKLATGGCYNVGVSRAGELFIWGSRSEKWPDCRC